MVLCMLLVVLMGQQFIKVLRFIDQVLEFGHLLLICICAVIILVVVLKKSVFTSILKYFNCFLNAGVFTLDGRLYVIGGKQNSTILNSVEIYNPDTNTWSMETLPVSGTQIYGAVVVNRPSCFRTNWHVYYMFTYCIVILSILDFFSSIKYILK